MIVLHQEIERSRTKNDAKQVIYLIFSAYFHKNLEFPHNRLANHEKKNAVALHLTQRPTIATSVTCFDYLLNLMTLNRVTTLCNLQAVQSKKQQLFDRSLSFPYLKKLTSICPGRPTQVRIPIWVALSWRIAIVIWDHITDHKVIAPVIERPPITDIRGLVLRVDFVARIYFWDRVARNQMALIDVSSGHVVREVRRHGSINRIAMMRILKKLKII